MIQNMKIKQKIWVDEKMTYKNYLDQEMWQPTIKKGIENHTQEFGQTKLYEGMGCEDKLVMVSHLIILYKQVLE